MGRSRSLAPRGPRSPEAPSPRRGRHLGRASRPRSSGQEMAIGTQESPLWLLWLFLFHGPSQTSGGRVTVNVSDTSEKGLTLRSSAPLYPHGGEGWQPCFPTKWRHVSPARNGVRQIRRDEVTDSRSLCGEWNPYSSDFLTVAASGTIPSLSSAPRTSQHRLLAGSSRLRLSHDLPGSSELFHLSGGCREPPGQPAPAGSYTCLSLGYYFDRDDVAPGECRSLLLQIG
ncbi:hypothetical protein LEMLEM_LOCUS12577 [Lemmus lemmus]